jgi:hypothetical protein
VAGAAAVVAARTSLLLLLLFADPAWAQPTDKRSLFTDPEDGKLDASEWLLERKGFLPVPILIGMALAATENGTKVAGMACVPTLVLRAATCLSISCPSSSCAASRSRATRMKTRA